MWVQAGACAPNPCPQPGRCCLFSGACAITLQAACNAPWALGGSCVPQPCGVCCTSLGACTFVVQGVCAASWSVGGVCTPNPCAAVGACCQGVACTTTTAALCPGAYLGDASVCAPRVRSGHINACCPNDFNGSGSLSVADVFDFLNSWFAGCP
jgi:hypothetical protein